MKRDNKMIITRGLQKGGSQRVCLSSNQASIHQ